MSIILISLVVTIFITIVRYYMTDREKMKEIKARQKELRKEMKEFKHDPAKMMEINQKMLEDFPEQMKESFKPMFITLIPLLILFVWLRGTYADTVIASTWIWWSRSTNCQAAARPFCARIIKPFPAARAPIRPWPPRGPAPKPPWSA